MGSKTGIKAAVLLIFISSAWGCDVFVTCDPDDFDGGPGSFSDADGDGDSDADADVTPPDCETDTASGLCWQDPRAASRMSWDDATDYCAAFGSGWRLPSIAEYSALLGGCDSTNFSDGAEKTCNSCNESTRCAELFSDPDEFYWSSTKSGATAAWVADFEQGVLLTRLLDQGVDPYVRCVNDPGE